MYWENVFSIDFYTAAQTDMIRKFPQNDLFQMLVKGVHIQSSIEFQFLFANKEISRLQLNIAANSCS